MDHQSSTSDANTPGGGKEAPPYAGLTSCVLPKANRPNVSGSHTGVSTNNAPSEGNGNVCRKSKTTAEWYALRTTYGREKKAYDYLVAHGIEASYPTLKSFKMMNGKRVAVEQSRIPNMFFAYGTEEQLKAYVYDNVNLPYLRFYYQHTHLGNKVLRTPLVVPKHQIEGMKIICDAEACDKIVVAGEVRQFKEGQSVRVVEGEFKGVTGKVARYKNQQRVGIVIKGVMTVCTAYIPSAFMRAIEEE